MIKFNVEDEPSFLDLLEQLGDEAVDDVLGALADIESQNLNWEQFVHSHGWQLIQLAGQDTYPGADPLHWFAVVGTSGAEYQIAAKGPYQAVVVCAVARSRP